MITKEEYLRQWREDLLKKKDEYHTINNTQPQQQVSQDFKIKDIKKQKGLSFWDKRKLNKKPERSFLVTMMFSNGTCKNFVVEANSETFEYNKKNYYLRYEDSWFNITHNQYELFFFDDHPVPLDRSITKQGDKKFWSVTSENLKPLIDMNYVKVLASSQELEQFMKTATTILIFVVFVLIVLGYKVFDIAKLIKTLPVH